ncbi:MAG TPA: carboxypeptidase regulatory-like domain-containing protein [Candidatus Kapabacteria bacterium]|nr:carboxypeptidase regulatory-like domain-containing protein [Candidatus Kapabacteria bacterium]
MNTRLLLLPLLLALISTVALAQLSATTVGTITGTVVTSEGRPVAGAAVEVLGTVPRLGSYARLDGSYRIRSVRAGTYRLRITAAGFLADTVDVTVRAGGEVAMGLTVKPAPAMATRTDGYKVRGGRGGLAMGDGGTAMVMSAPPPAMAAGAEGSSGSRAIAVESSGASPMDFGEVGDAAPSRSVGASRDATLSRRMSVSKEAPRAATATAPASTTEDRPTTIPDERIEPMPPTEPQRPGQLTAGEWSDLMNWDFWRDVAGSEEFGKHLPYWGFDPSSRISVIAVDGERLVADAEVTLTDGQNGTIWRARTDNRGRAELFVGVAGRPAGTYRVEVRSGESKAFVNNVAAGSTGPVIVKLRDAAASPTTLDVMFVIDATGSMGDEITYIKSELESVIDRVRENHSDRIAIRLGANFYRDQGDDYVVRSFPFTESTFEAIGFIRDNEAGGGGDFPEAVEEALADGIDNHEWSPSARARIMFLVLDAPPHYDEGRIRQIQDLARRAAEKGIRIIPVASSGIDKETEFLLRLLGIYSGGTYTFLTDDSGIGNSHLKPSIGKHDIEYLDDLMVRLIGRWVSDVAISDELRAALR